MSLMHPVLAAILAIALLAPAAAAATLVVAAADASAADLAAADLRCDGVDDQREINNAFNLLPGEVGTVQLTAGTFNCSASIFPNGGCEFFGAGQSATRIVFINPANTNIPISVTQPDVHLRGFTIMGSGAVMVRVSRVVVEEVTATSRGPDGKFNPAGGNGMFYVWADSRTVEDVAFIDCTAEDAHTHGFSMNGINQPKVTRNIRFENCVARRCGFGVAGGSRSDYITGFDIQEDNDVDSVQVINCRAEDNWQSGFHFEPGEDKGTIKKAITFQGCTAERNGQRNPAAYPYTSTFLSGFYVHFNAAVTDCTSIENKNAGFYVEGGDSVVFTRCTDSGSTYGWKVVKNARNILLEDCTSTGAEKWAFWSAYATNITLARFRQIDAGGDLGFQSILGWYYNVPAYQQPVTDSSFEIAASGDRSFGIINQAGSGNTYLLSWEGDPTITGIAPSMGNQGQTITVSVAGTNFQPNAQVKLTGGTTTIQATAETTPSATQIRCTVAIPSTAYLGDYAVSVQNPGTTTWVSKAGAFRVMGPLTATDISPLSASPGATITATISGTNFASGAQVKLISGTTTITATGETLISATQVKCTLTVPSTAPLGPYTLSVQNPGMSTWASKTGAFTVTASTSTVTGISPASMARGATLTNVAISGTNFASGAQVKLTGGTTTILATAETTTSATQIKCTVAVPSTAYLGAYTVSVQNPGMTTWVSKASAFTVVGPATVTGISPVSMARGATLTTVSISGTNFAAGAQVRLTGGTTTILATAETTTSATQIKCTVAIPSTAYVGNYTVSVQNPGTTTWVSKTGAFKVLGPSTIASISPTTANRASTVKATISGTNFAPGAQVRLTGGTTTISASSETTNAAGTQITCTVAVPSTAYLGYYAVSVQNPGTTTWIAKASAFNVIGPLTVTGISPTSARRGTTVTAYVSSTNFASGAQVRLTGGGTTISATGETLISASQIKCTVAVPSTAYLGYYTVSVQNTGMTTWVSKASAFRTL